MKHLGDITQINGSMVEPVNVIIGGSPCQDLSVAGRRAGLAGERSGLFMEQIRIIKEMRCADAARGRTGTDIRPRWMVWENVPGAFSSNKGEDFGAVLQETIKIAEPQVPAVSVPKNGWPTAGCLTDVGGKWSVAWRVFDTRLWKALTPTPANYAAAWTARCSSGLSTLWGSRLPHSTPGAVAAPVPILPIWTALGNAMRGMPSQGNALRCPKT